MIILDGQWLQSDLLYLNKWLKKESGTREWLYQA